MRDVKLNTSKGTIHAYDLQDLNENEIVQWLSDFGVVGAKRFTRKVNGRVEGTPTILLTFDRPTCPQRLELDYVTYHVKRYIPNPLMCHQCGEYGHPETGCGNPKKCLKCGGNYHDGSCATKCLHCDSITHTCLSRECPKWIKEKEICTIKVEQEISYVEARRRQESARQPPNLQSYADVVRVSNERQNEGDLREKVEKLEKKMDDVANILLEVTTQLKAVSETLLRGQLSQMKDDQAAEQRIVAEKTDGGKKTTSSTKKSTPNNGPRPGTTVNRGSKLNEDQPTKSKRKAKEGTDDNSIEMVATTESVSSQIIGQRGRSLDRGNRKSWIE